MASKSTNEDESYEFVREKIKERPINKKKLLMRTLLTALFALLFGIIACLAFFLMEPIISNWVSPDKETEAVNLPEDKNEKLPEDTLPPENEVADETYLADQPNLNDNNTGSSESLGNSSSLNESDASANPGGDATSANVAEVPDSSTSKPGASETPSDSDTSTGTDSANTATPSEVASPQLSASDYEKLYTELSGIAHEAMKSMVQVTYVTSEFDLFMEGYDKDSIVSGIIVDISDTAIHIFTKRLKTPYDGVPYITFEDGTVTSCEVISSDIQTGTCLLSVPVSELSESALNTINVATLGSSNIGLNSGRPVIAIGSPASTGGFLSFGFITSVNGIIHMMDANYTLITTDIYGSRSASGVLINYSGNVIGFIDNSSNDDDLQNQISAIGITELRRVIDTLQSEKEKSRFGIYGTDITYSLSQSLSLPRGIYVNRFEIGSPAMKSGIKANDIITQIDDTQIHSMMELTNYLMTKKPGDEIVIHLERQVKEEFKSMELNVVLDTQ